MIDFLTSFFKRFFDELTMPVAKLARNILSQENLGKLKELKVPGSLKVRSKKPFKFSTNVETHVKLSHKDVYMKLISGQWKISPPEASKTSTCWKNGIHLIVEQPQGESNYCLTGWFIHHAWDANDVYCGWLSKQQGPKVRTSDMTNHFKGEFII